MGQTNDVRRGDTAEDHFKSMITRAGFTAHPPRRDRRGWDFIIEFPENVHEKFAPSEIFNRPVEHKALVQVKGIRGASSRSISLQQWERFTKDPRPCFFYVLEVDEHDEPSRAFLIHVDRELVGQVAERLAGLDEGEVSNFRNLTKTLNWSQYEGFDPTDWKILREKLETAAGTSPDDYARRKREWIEEAGFGEEPKYGGKATISADSEEELLDKLNHFYLGQSERLEFDRFEAFEQRFGEKVRAPEQLRWKDGQSEAWATIEGVPGTLMVGISDELRRRPVRIECDVYSNARIVEEFEQGDEHLVFRAESDRVEFSIEGGQVSLSLKPLSETHKPLSLSNLADAGRVGRLFHVAVQRERPLKVQLEMQGGAARSPEIAIPSSPPEDESQLLLYRLLAAAVRAENVARRAGLGELHVTPESLISQAQTLAFLDLLCRPSQEQQIVFSSKVDTDDDLTGQPIAATLVLAVQLGDYVVAVAGALRGTADEVVANDCDWPRVKAESTTPVLLVEPRAFSQAETPSSAVADFLQSAREEVESWADREDVELININDFIATSVP